MAGSGFHVQPIASLHLEVAVFGMEHDAARDAVEHLVVAVRVPFVLIPGLVPSGVGAEAEVFLSEPDFDLPLARRLDR